MPFRIGFVSDTHLGYAAKVRTHAASGLNMRVRDGMLALNEIVTGMLDAEVDVVVHGGDLFHRSWPQVADIVWARRQFERLAAARIPVIINTGNHDASLERGKTAATAAVHDPDRGITVVKEPYSVVHAADGLDIHVLSHYGLARAERLVPEPTSGSLSVLTAHGAAMVPGHDVFTCVDSPGEQPIGADLLVESAWLAKLLGHYHGMGPLPGLDGDESPAWYAGSTVRRGFSDPPGGRGWLLVEVTEDNRITVSPQYIWQRPQHDLPVVDAAGLTGVEVQERIRANIAAVDMADAIVRQVVVNVTGAHRAGMDLPGLAPLTDPALMWMPVLRRPEVPVLASTDAGDGEAGSGVAGSLVTAGSADLPAVWRGWVSDWSQTSAVPEALRDTIRDAGEEHLRAVSVGDADADGIAGEPSVSVGEAS